MGARRKKKTLTLKGKPEPSNTVNCSVSARNLRKSDLGGVIFGCKHSTIAECYSHLLFGLPGSHFSYVKNVRPGMPLFLFNYSDRKLHGIFEAVSAGQMNIDPYAWVGNGAEHTPYPAQALVRIEKQCQPLKEDQYRPIIADNYYEPRVFWQELDHTQTKNLISLFSLSPVDVSARDDMARHNTRQTNERNKAECNALKSALHESNTSPFIPNVEHNTLVASSSTSNQPKTWSSLFKHSTSTEPFKEDEAKIQPSDLNLADSNQYNLEWDSSSVPPCVEGGSQNFEAVQEDSTMWNEEQMHAGSESGGESSSSSFQEGTFFEALVNDPKQEGERGDTILLYENLPRSDGCDMGWDSTCGTTHMNGEIPHLEASMHADVKKDGAKVYEKEVSEHSYSSGDNHGEASDAVDSESAYSSEALAVADMESVVAKLIQEIEGLKDSQFKQVQKIGFLEKELVESRVEVHDLKNRCDQLESRLLPQIGHVQEAVLRKFDDLILLVGGFDGCSWLSALDSYSPSQDMVKSLKPMTFLRSFASAATLDGELYIFGGVDAAGTWHDTVESYNPTDDQWVSRPSLNQKKASVAGASLNGKIYAIGGGNGVECYAEVEMLDMNIGRWITTQSMLQKPKAGSIVFGFTKIFGLRSSLNDIARIINRLSERFAPVAAEVNGSLYVAGGYDGRNYLNSVERFDPREHSWTRVGSMSTRRGCHSVAVVNGKLYALGGYNGNEMVATVEIFDPRVGSWMIGEPMNYAKGYSGAAAIGEKIFVIGGVNERDKIFDTVECYKEGSAWEVTNLETVGKRCYFSAVVL